MYNPAPFVTKDGFISKLCYLHGALLGSQWLGVGWQGPEELVVEELVLPQGVEDAFDVDDQPRHGSPNQGHGKSHKQRNQLETGKRILRGKIYQFFESKEFLFTLEFQLEEVCGL